MAITIFFTIVLLQHIHLIPFYRNILITITALHISLVYATYAHNWLLQNTLCNHAKFLVKRCTPDVVCTKCLLPIMHDKLLTPYQALTFKIQTLITFSQKCDSFSQIQTTSRKFTLNSPQFYSTGASPMFFSSTTSLFRSTLPHLNRNYEKYFQFLTACIFAKALLFITVELWN